MERCLASTCANAEPERDQGEADWQHERAQSECCCTPRAKRAAKKEAHDRRPSVLRAFARFRDAVRVPSEEEVANVHRKARDVRRHDRGCWCPSEGDAHERILDGHRRYPEHAGNDHAWRVGADAGSVATQMARNAQSSMNCSNRSARSGEILTRSSPSAKSRVAASATMNTGTEIIRASDASLRATMCAARMTRLPVMCAVSSPSPRKPMTSTLPAIMPSRNGSSLVRSVSSTDGTGKLLACRNAVPGSAVEAGGAGFGATSSLIS